MAAPELKLVISAETDDAMRKIALLKAQLEDLKRTMQGSTGVSQAGKEVKRLGQSIATARPFAKKFADIAGGLNEIKNSADLLGTGLSLAADVGILAAVSSAQAKAGALKSDVDSMKAAVNDMLTDMGSISAGMSDVDKWTTTPAEKAVSVKISFRMVTEAESETDSFSAKFSTEFDAIRVQWATFKTDASNAVAWFEKNVTSPIIGQMASITAAAVAAVRAINELASPAPDIPSTKKVIDDIVREAVKNAPTGTWGNHRFAGGGFPTVGEMFIAREAGPELVGQIGHRTAVANNDQIVQGVASGVAAGQVDELRILTRIAGLLDGISRKPLTATVQPSSGLGRVLKQSAELYSTNTGI